MKVALPTLEGIEMTIKIVEDGPPITLTASQHARLRQEYSQCFQFYSGVPPTFEQWVRRKLDKSTSDSTNVTGLYK